MCVCIKEREMCALFYRHAWRHDFRVTPHTRWLRHTHLHLTCMHLAELVTGACTPLTCFLHAHLSHTHITAPCHHPPHLLLLPSTSPPPPLLKHTHTRCLFCSCQKKSAGSWAHVKDPTKWTTQIDKERSCRYMTYARECMENMPIRDACGYILYYLLLHYVAFFYIHYTPAVIHSVIDAWCIYELNTFYFLTKSPWMYKELYLGSISFYCTLR